jgi:hypothetical protein
LIRLQQPRFLQHGSQHGSQQHDSAQPHDGSQQASAQPQLGSQQASAQPQLGSQHDSAQPHEGSQQPHDGSQQSHACLQARRAFMRANKPCLQHGSQQGSQQDISQPQLGSQHDSAQPHEGSQASAQPQLGSQPQPPSRPKNAEAFPALDSAMATPSADSRDRFMGEGSLPDQGILGAASVAVDRLGTRPIKVDGADAEKGGRPSSNQRGRHVESVGAIGAAASTASPIRQDSQIGSLCPNGTCGA